MTGTSVSLLERLRQPDDREAWNRFVGLYTPLIFAWARQVGLQESDAADLVQDVFTLLIDKIASNSSTTVRGAFGLGSRPSRSTYWRTRLPNGQETGPQGADTNRDPSLNQLVTQEVEAFLGSGIPRALGRPGTADHAD